VKGVVVLRRCSSAQAAAQSCANLCRTWDYTHNVFNFHHLICSRLVSPGAVCSSRRGSVCWMWQLSATDGLHGTVSPAGAQWDGGGDQSLKLMSLWCARRRQLSSEFTVLEGRQAPPPPLCSSVFDVSQAFTQTVLYEGRIPTTEDMLCKWFWMLTSASANLFVLLGSEAGRLDKGSCLKSGAPPATCSFLEILYTVFHLYFQLKRNIFLSTAVTDNDNDLFTWCKNGSTVSSL